MSFQVGEKSLKSGKKPKTSLVNPNYVQSSLVKAVNSQLALKDGGKARYSRHQGPEMMGGKVKYTPKTPILSLMGVEIFSTFA